MGYRLTGVAWEWYPINMGEASLQDFRVMRGSTKEQLIELTVAVLDAVNQPARFPAQEVFSLLCERLGAPGAVLQCIDWASGESEIVLSGYPSAWVPQLQQATRLLRYSHPLLVANALGDLRPATAQEAAGGWGAWQRSPSHAFFTEFVRQPQIVSLGLQGSARQVVGMAFARSGLDFKPSEVAFLAEVQPILQALDRHVRRLQAWSSSIPAGTAPSSAAARDAGLTGREVEVLVLLGEALTAAAAARRLRCSPRTVHKHIASIFRKLGVHDRLGAVLEAQRRGLLSLPCVAAHRHVPVALTLGAETCEVFRQ